jgi:uncharacterized membrane protein YfcA
MGALEATLSGALPEGGLGLLVLGAVLAGLVRGFTGFGTALVYMPFAAQVLPPVWGLVTLIVIDLIGPLPAVPRALRDGDPPDVLRLGAGAVVGVPLGALVLTALDPEVFRYTLSALALGLLVLLVSGVRYRGTVGLPLLYVTGGLGGFSAGATGLGGPPVILLYMARPLPPAVIRANTLLFLLLADVLLIAVFGMRGLMAWTPLVLGLVLIPPYIGALMLGSAIFDPARERLYRTAAYVVIAGSALGGLPLFD